ncbi:iron ABC transporter permease [Vineibacter terrae]|uniref:Iron ABC transporter permease n=1 Tax=Vineibacter terrae TaxID=2586908 RepID=A0A5C8P8C3_9HYPH|nr:iron ABC transporter permease [Vineibacter terrae]TXL69789.1 iron ABC transporter permease [Vineibacter terrae]
MKAVGRYRWALVALPVVVLAAISVLVGPAGLDWSAAIRDALSGRDSVPALVLVEIRLPRALLGAVVGAALGMAGAAMQGLLRNPLAEPGVLGVSACAALGAVIAFYTGLVRLFPGALPIAAMLGALLGTAALFAWAGRGATVATLLLVGVAINALAGAATAFSLALSPNPYAFYEVMFWLMGSLADRSLDHVALALPCVALGAVPLLLMRRGLDGLSLGEETALALGISPSAVARWIGLGTALTVGGAVAVSGVIGFVGLMAPHAVRPFVRYRPGATLVASAGAGAALTLAADIAVRLLPTGRELQLGVMTALLGAPFLGWLAVRRRRGNGSRGAPWL